jgi:peptide/nickel transport system substrate-binding protein
MTWFRRLTIVVIAPFVLAACAPQAPASAPTQAAKPTAPAAAPAAPAAPAGAPTVASSAAPTAAAPAALQPTPGAATAKAPAAKRNLVIATAGDISKLDPQMSTSSNDIYVSFNIFDNLLTRDPDLKLMPQLATEYKSLNDTTWEFKLRPNVKFHNGDALTSSDVKFTIDRTYDPGANTLVKTVFTTIDHIETPDELTVRFVTKKPDPLLPARLAFYGGQIIPEKYFMSVGADGFNQRPVGSGPVKFKEWVKDDHLLLEANTAYWGGAPDFDTVAYKPVPEPAGRIASLLSGEADLMTKVPSDQVQRVNSSGKTRVEGAFYAGLYVLGVNSKQPPLDNPKIKQALSLAIDRDAILKNLWRGQGIVPNGPVAKGDSLGYDPSRPPLAFDLNKAKQRLQEAGYKGEPIIIESTQGQLQNDREMSEAIAEMWKKAGVAVQVELIESSVRAEKNRDKSFKGLWWGDPTSTLQDPDGMMWRLLSPGGAYDYWRDPEFDRAGEEARFSMDTKLREADYKKMSDVFLENFPWLPVIQPVESYGVQNYLNWRPSPNQTLQLRKEVLKFNR